MKIIKVSVLAFSILLLATKASAFGMMCDFNGFCTAPLWVSNGLGGTWYLELQKADNNVIVFNNLPNEVRPAGPGQAYTIETGLIEASITDAGSNEVIYRVFDKKTNRDIGSCTFTFHLSQPGNLSASGSCSPSNILAAPVNQISEDGNPGFDIGVN